MIKFIIKMFIKDSENVSDAKVRTQYGTLAGILGIVLNFILFCAKLISGIIINSIAVISDSFNNLSDMGSSLVAAIGMKMSNRRPDKEHPFGHGRIEYISALIVSFIILLVGFELFKGSVDKILNPQDVKLSLVPMLILVLSVFVKLWMFIYNRYIGKKINSEVVKATAQDSLNDCIASTLLSSRASFPVDGIFGCIVSIMICFTGFSVAKNTIGILLGTPPEPEMVNEISEIILSRENIVGIHDLIVHDYGPGRIMASVHAEVPNDADIEHIHEIIDETEKYIEYNHAYSKLATNLDEKILCMQNILAIDEGNVDAYRTLYDIALKNNAGSEKLTKHFESILKYSDSSDESIKKEVVFALSHLPISCQAQCDFAKQLLRYYPSKIDELEIHLRDLCKVMLREGYFTEAEYFAQIPAMAEAALADKCTKTNPKVPTIKDLEMLYAQLW